MTGETVVCSRLMCRFFLSFVFALRGPHPSVLRRRVLGVLSLCFLLVQVACPREVHLVQ